jgi:hypothetical protein
MHGPVFLKAMDKAPTITRRAAISPTMMGQKPDYDAMMMRISRR